MDDFRDVEGFHTWASITWIDKGWSSDKKYHILTKDKENLLLRLSPPDMYEAKLKEFKIIQAVDTLKIPMSSPYTFGRCDGGVYMILKWLEGDPLEDVIADLDEDMQYALGLEAGQTLKAIHGLEIEAQDVTWSQKFNKKLDVKIKKYQACPLKYEGGQVFLDVIEAYRHTLSDRPMVLHHGDYHSGNMILTTTGQVGIIDFNRYDVGDPWEEFNRIVWDSAISPAFAAGRIDGYFDGCVPQEFFQCLALYICSNTLSSLPWALAFGPKDVQVMRDQAQSLRQTYDDFKVIVPRWYSTYKKSHPRVTI